MPLELGPVERDVLGPPEPEEPPPAATGALPSGTPHRGEPKPSELAVAGRARVGHARRGQDLVGTQLPREPAGPGVQRPGRPPLPRPRVHDEQAKDEPLGLRPVAHRTHELPGPLGDDEPLLEGDPPRYPVELQEVRYLRLVVGEAPTHLRARGHPGRPPLSRRESRPDLARLPRQRRLLGFPDQILPTTPPRLVLHPQTHLRLHAPPVLYNCHIRLGQL